VSPLDLSVPWASPSPSRRGPRRIWTSRRRTRAVRGPGRVGELDQYLLRRYRLHGDISARQKLITMYLPLVRSLARRYASRGEQFDDLGSRAIGLIKPSTASTWSVGGADNVRHPNIVGEIKRYFRDKGWSVRVPRGLQELNIRINKIVDELVIKLQRSPTVTRSPWRRVTPADVLEALETSQAYNSVSLQSSRLGVGDDEGPHRLSGEDKRPTT